MIDAKTARLIKESHLDHTVVWEMGPEDAASSITHRIVSGPREQYFTLSLTDKAVVTKLLVDAGYAVVGAGGNTILVRLF